MSCIFCRIVAGEIPAKKVLEDGDLVGFLTAIGALEKGAVWPGLVAVYNYAWFVGFLLSGSIYLLLMRWQAASQPAPFVAGAVAQPAAASLAQ